MTALVARVPGWWAIRRLTPDAGHGRPGLLPGDPARTHQTPGHVPRPGAYRAGARAGFLVADVRLLTTGAGAPETHRARQDDRGGYLLVVAFLAAVLLVEETVVFLAVAAAFFGDSAVAPLAVLALAAVASAGSWRAPLT